MYRFAMINLVKLHRELKFKNIPSTMNNLLQLLTFPRDPGPWFLSQAVWQLWPPRLLGGWGGGGSYCKQLEKIFSYLSSIYRHRCN